MPIEFNGKLVFARPQDGTGRLVFGADDGSGIAPADAVFSGDATLGDAFGATLPALGQVLWNANVSRGERHVLRALYQQAAPAGNRTATRWQPSATISARTECRWQVARPVAGHAQTRWQQSQHLSARAAEMYQDGAALRHNAATPWQESDPLRAAIAAAWQDASPLRRVLLSPWQEAIRLRDLLATRWQYAAPINHRSARHNSAAASPAGRRASLRWQDAIRPPVGLSRFVPPVVVPEPCYDPATLGRLEFTTPWVLGDARLVFVCNRATEAPQSLLYILPARYYMAVHSLTAARLPDSEPVAIFDVSLAADKGSFDWSFSARARREAIEQFAPVSGLRPAIQITLDGIAFVFTVDKIVESEAFGQRGVTISGRSVTGLIGGQHARETSRLSASPATAQQLAIAALEYSGVDLDWGIPDWLVPAGAWSHTGTPLAAVQAIVEASGGYLQSHRTLPRLLARHPYPDLPGGLVGAPWHWERTSFAADVNLAPDALMVVGTEHIDGAEVNAVYVSGVSQGVRALYKRFGTAGDKLAPMVSDPLIVAPEVARMRGRSIVGAAGAKHMVSIELPVLTGPSQPGVLDVGQLVQINAASPWRGRVRSVRASAKFGEKVRQTVQLERHLEQV